LGLPAVRLIRRRECGTSAVTQELVTDAATYAYIAASTTVAFSLFGGVAGHYADQLARLATIDALTGLLNARAFDLRLRGEAARISRYRRLSSAERFASRQGGTW
jgi:GGDEF domain-containing protein